MSSYYLDMLIWHFKGEGFVVVWIQRAFLDGGFLFPQPFSILHQGDLHVGICNCNPIRISFSRNSLERRISPGPFYYGQEIARRSEDINLYTWKPSDIHFLEILCFKNDNRQFPWIWHVSQWKADVTQLWNKRTILVS